MRFILASAAGAAALLAGCATAPMDGETYAAEYQQLSAQCAAQGGVLVPLDVDRFGQDPATDYACSRRDRLLN